MGTEPRSRGSAPRRIILELDQLHAGRIELEGGQAHYLGTVLRLRAGTRIIACDGRGRESSAVVVSSGAKAVVLELDEPREVAESPVISVSLVLPLGKGDKPDLVVQKATELGVAEIYPTHTERGVVRLEDDRGARRLRRWERIAEEAARQCERVRLPRLHPIRGWDQQLREAKREVNLCFFEGAAPGSGRAVLTRPAPPAAAIAVGPEGGLVDAETRAATEAGFELVSLGPRILRYETAAIAAVAVVQHQWGDLG